MVLILGCIYWRIPGWKGILADVSWGKRENVEKKDERVQVKMKVEVKMVKYHRVK
jgi:DsbC/DsbD-like thiol-disulfide interchange protein